MTVDQIVATLLLLAGALVALPALLAAAGPDDDDPGHVTPGWRKDHRDGGAR